jgi:hypothetical protein
MLKIAPAALLHIPSAKKPRIRPAQVSIFFYFRT